MATPTEPRREHPSTYFVQDRSNQDELTRLVLQDKIVTAGMGGVLTEQPDPALFQRVLDVACGTGGWLLETAETYPTISLLAGVDVSATMMEYARARAADARLIDRVEFRAMDALRMLEFPANFFDLVNIRFGASFVRVWEWPKLLSEMQRVSRPGGVIRITENNPVIESNSPALTRLFAVIPEAFHHAGNIQNPVETGMTDEIAPMMQRHGIRQVQTQVHLMHYRAGTEEGRLLYENMKHFFRAMPPFLRKWIRLPDDYEESYQRALVEMQQPDFTATWRMLTTWGTSGT